MTNYERIKETSIHSSTTEKVENRNTDCATKSKICSRRTALNQV